MVLDAGAFYAGVPFGTANIKSTDKSYELSPDIKYVTSQSVYDEISHIKKDHDAITILIETGRLLIQSPEPEYINQTYKAALFTGDLPNLSEPDISAIALCIQTRFTLVSDDFAMLNVMRQLKMNTVSIMTRGIKRFYRWQYYCSGCGYVLSTRDMYRVYTDMTLHKKNKHIYKKSKKLKNISKKIITCELCGSALNRRTIKNDQ